ncbi:MAG: DUF4169 family protein [Caulobacteraceae bacterium]
MAAEPINLNKARKATKRAGKAAQAAENRVAFGRTKAEKASAKAKAALSERSLDGHKRD